MGFHMVGTLPWVVPALLLAITHRGAPHESQYRRQWYSMEIIQDLLAVLTFVAFFMVVLRLVH